MCCPVWLDKYFSIYLPITWPATVAKKTANDQLLLPAFTSICGLGGGRCKIIFYRKGNIPTSECQLSNLLQTINTKSWFFGMSSPNFRIQPAAKGCLVQCPLFVATSSLPTITRVYIGYMSIYLQQSLSLHTGNPIGHSEQLLPGI